MSRQINHRSEFFRRVVTAWSTVLSTSLPIQCPQEEGKVTWLRQTRPGQGISIVKMLKER